MNLLNLFFFSNTDWRTKAKKPSLPNELLIARKKQEYYVFS